MRAAVEDWTGYIDAIATGLQRLVVTDAHGDTIPAAEGFARWVAMTHAIDERGGQLFIIGNGGSAGMASHMVTDALTNGRLRAIAMTDPTMLTATANDASFDDVFALQVERLGRSGDLLIALSCSGNSRNIVRAVEMGRSRDLQTVTVSAMKADNACRTRGHLNFFVPLARYGWAQSAHQVILHYWFDQYLDRHRTGAL
jgi:D-sedoheptulose 7-phosphate isomerase